MEHSDYDTIESIAKQIRWMTVKAIGESGAGHIGGSLSIVDLLTVLYYKHMNVDPKNPKMEGRDRLAVSKGHAGPAVYATLAHKGFFDEAKLQTLNCFNTSFPSHCDMNLTPGIDMTTGSLGQGFSCAVGFAIGSKILKDKAFTYTIIGDGESQEGQIWEAAMLAAQKKLDNLIAFTDFNNMQIDGYVSDINALSNISERWKAFGWDVQMIDGHDVIAIDQSIEYAKNVQYKPHMIILNTTKGKGVTEFEKLGVENHYIKFTQDKLCSVLGEME